MDPTNFEVSHVALRPPIYTEGFPERVLDHQLHDGVPEAAVSSISHQECCRADAGSQTFDYGLASFRPRNGLILVLLM
jgi:hypothetical protein